MSDFAEAARVIDESVAMRLVRAVLHAVLRRARLLASRTATWMPRSANATLKGSFYTVVILTGIITHAILLQFMPARLAPVKPMAYWMVLAFGAFAAASGFITRRSSTTATADNAAGTAKTKNNS